MEGAQMEMTVDFPGGARVDAHFGPFAVATDQPPTASAPTPFDMFLASLATCAGIYVLGFCRQRNLDSTGIQLVQRSKTDPATGMVTEIEIDIQVPAGFPEKYLPALIHTAELCKVKKHLEHPPKMAVVSSVISS
jgi:putative redox protein